MNNKKYACILGMLLIVFSGIEAQVIKVESGVAFSKQNGDGFSSETIYPFQMSIGIDYFDNNWFNLSSNVGYISKGGKHKLYLPTVENPSLEFFGNVRDYSEYTTVNTTFQLKKQRINDTYYIGLGPRIDIKMRDHLTINGPTIDVNDDMEDNPVNTKVLYGLKCEAGFKYNINEIQIGANVSYLPSFNKRTKSTSLRDQTFTVGLSVGYILK